MSDLRIDGDTRRPARMSGLLPRAETPIVPKNSIAGRALVAVVAIMTFLSSLTIGAVVLVRGAASEWQSDVAREVTIQVRPAAGRDIEADIRQTTDIARGFRGIADVRPYSKEESARLLEPWLGAGLVLDDLPVPRMIVVRLSADVSPDLAQLRRTLAERVPSASLDDHRAWIERMRTMASTSVVGGLGILALMLLATVLSVTFATRAAMATNRPIVEVLHFIGARDSYVASQFQRHFLMLGLQGGLIGGGGAMLLFLIAGFVVDFGRGTASADQITALFGTLSIGFTGYAMIVAQILLIAIITALTSRRTVNRTLKSVE
jgi:cell division transport system permease protein